MVRLVFILMALLWLGEPFAVAGDRVAVVGFSNREALRLGQRLYRNGILSSGEPIRAIVQGDIPVDGRLFTCERCHRRSGLGASERSVVVPPINGTNLYRMRTRWDAWKRHSQVAVERPGSPAAPAYLLGSDVIRPAYTADTLARALRQGIDPAGRTLDPIMPHFALPDQDMALLLSYLQSLSSALSPGVTDGTIHFATISSDGVDPSHRDTMLAVLRAYLNDRNAQPRHQAQRAQRGAFIRREVDVAYRRLDLAHWQLHGPRETWPRQLLAYYQKEPVFALLGGMVVGDWAPIHTFCEQQHIPCLFPLTDRPVIASTDGHTLYFSKGLYQEGEAAARYLRGQQAITPGTRVVQVFRSGEEGAVVAQGFQETWQRLGQTDLETRSLQPTDSLLTAFWRELMAPQKPTVLLLWLGKESAASLPDLMTPSQHPLMVFVSSSLLEDNLHVLPDTVRDVVYITYPYSLPDENTRRFTVLDKWLENRQIPASHRRLQAKLYFLGWMLASALADIHSEFYGDYFLEAIDMMADQTHAIAIYPRLSFGPGQRYASKGCYIVQLSKGPTPSLVRKSAWVVH